MGVVKELTDICPDGELQATGFTGFTGGKAKNILSSLSGGCLHLPFTSLKTALKYWYTQISMSGFPGMWDPEGEPPPSSPTLLPANSSSDSLSATANLSDHSPTDSVGTFTTPRGAAMYSPSSPPSGAGTLSPPQIVALAASTPSSPMVSRPSSGKLKEGMKKLLRIPTNSAVSTSAGALPLATMAVEVSEHPSRARLTRRVLPGVRVKFLTFRRMKRRSDKQYHSDDGYTSDPGQIREEEDDETDGDREVDSTYHLRRAGQVRAMELKLMKARQQLAEEEGSCRDFESEYLQGIDSATNDKDQQRMKSRFQSRHVKMKATSDQHRKKVTKLETQLKGLREEQSSTSRSQGTIKGRIGGGMNRLRGRFSIRPGHRWSGTKRHANTESPQEDVLGEDDEDELFPDDGDGLPPNDLGPPGALPFGNSSDLLAAGRVTMGEEEEEEEDEEEEEGEVSSDLRCLKEQATHFEKQLSMLYDKLEQEKERAERLECQVNDITELHQHEVEGLHSQLAQMETLNINKFQDLEDNIDEYKSKVEHLEVTIQTEEQPPIQRAPRKALLGLLTFMINLLVFFIATIQKITAILRTRVGLIISVLVLVLAVTFYFVCRFL